MRAGQALRGSSEFHAWGDSNLYLRRRDDTLSLTIEHRAASSPPSIMLELKAQGDALALRLVQPQTPTPSIAPSSIDERIIAALQQAPRPLTIKQLRPLCRVRNTTLYERLAALITAGQLLRTPEGYRLVVAN
jgi:hypothetical protein